MKTTYYLLLLFSSIQLFGQSNDTILSFEEYIGYVKQYHPLAKRAALSIEQGKAEIRVARGNFDPKLESEYRRKDFEQKDYYNILDTKLKVPTWFGLEIQAGFERASGIFLNPENDLPEDGLYSAGLKLDVFGIWINKRMAMLKQAKALSQQRNFEYELLTNEVVTKAAQAYFTWKNAHDNKILYSNFITAAEFRIKGIKRSIEVGDKAPIDSIEATIAIQNRQISLKQAEVDLQKARLDLETFLWTDDEKPLVLEDNIYPQDLIAPIVSSTLNLPATTVNLASFVSNHPKLNALNQKAEILKIERRLKIRKLFPKLNVSYNFISPTPDEINTFNTDEYKAGFNFSYPLFLRKERAKLKLNTLKQESLDFETKATTLQVTKKLKALINNILLYEDQLTLIEDAVKNYKTMLRAEERKFNMGESSLFYINTREQKLIDAQLKSNSVFYKLNTTKGKLYNALGLE